VLAGVFEKQLTEARVKVTKKTVTKAAAFTSGDLRRYKARPLNGIWATPPYLHNGSVPNLWELLQKYANSNLPSGRS
jgi:cytochrome c peroxidase